MEANLYAFRRPAGGLEGLYDWLLGQHVDETAATFLRDTLWYFYWFFLWPRSGDDLSFEIDASRFDRVSVVASVSMSWDGNDTAVRVADVSELNAAFKREVREPLADDFDVQMVFFEGRSSGATMGDPRGYRGEFVGNLVEDLRALMPGEALVQWMDTPNSRFAGEKPRDLVEKPDQRYLRDLILEARHGLPT